MYNVGIDVGSKELVMVIRHKGKNQKARSFKNTPEGHAQIIKALTSKKGKVRVCLEATGIYHFDLEGDPTPCRTADSTVWYRPGRPGGLSG